MRTLVVLCIVIGFLQPLPLSPKGKPKPKRTAAVPASPDALYVPALASANHFLRAWQTGDIETGIMLLTDSARRQSSEERLREYFAAPMPRGFEIQRGKKVSPARYSFLVALVEATEDHHIRRRYTEVVVVNHGMNDWAIDKLP